MPRITLTTNGALGKSSLREANERLVLHWILRNPGTARQEIAEHLSLSPSAVSGIMDRLLRGGLVREGDTPERLGPGRPRTSLYLNARARLVIGAEITAGGATIGAADLDGNWVSQRTVAPADDPVEFLRQVGAAIVELAESEPGHVLGAAVSLPLDLCPETGRVVAATNPRWHQIDVKAVLDGRLHLPLEVENDANLAAIAERWFRDPRTAWIDDFVFVTARGGIGAGLISGGKLVRGSHGRAGEFGHMVLFPQGRPCVCGRQGCWEEYASDRALARYYAARSGRPMGTMGIVSAARQGQPEAREALREAALHLAQGLANIVLALDPAAIVLDDFAAAGWDLVRDDIWNELRSLVAPHWLAGIELVPSQHAVHSSLAGAHALILSRYFTDVSPRIEARTVRAGV